MVATGLPIAAAPQGSKPGQPDAASTAAENLQGGFSETLLQLLGVNEPVVESPAPLANPLLQALLDGVEEDGESAPSTDAAALLAMLPLAQPADLRSAPVAVAPGTASPDAIASAASLEATMTAALVSADATQALKTPLQEPIAETAQSPADSTVPPSTGPLQSLTQETVNTARATANEGAVPRQLHAQVGTPAWSDELGARLQLMAEKGHHLASLRLSPEHLGPLEVQISVQDDQATVWFGASNVDTRAALEQALPRLRELFAAQGMSLAHSGVFQQSPQAQGQARPVPTIDGPSGGAAEISESAPVTVSRRGLLDAYA